MGFRVVDRMDQSLLQYPEPAANPDGEDFGDRGKLGSRRAIVFFGV